MGFLVRLLGTALGLWLATVLVPGIALDRPSDTGGRILAFVLVALVFGLVNAIVRPIVKVISLPLYVLTLGLFFLVVNALMLMLTGWLTGFTDLGLRVDGFGAALVGAIVVSIVSTVVEAILPSGDED